MFGFFKKSSPFKGSKRDPERYEKEKEIARTGDAKKRITLAKNSQTHKEILYYLADKDTNPKVRKAVADNEAMPVQVSPILAGDEDQDVRMALAKRLVKLLPGLSQDMQSQLYAFAVQSLGTLALDEVLKIRKALASTLKDHAHTPPKIAGQLARDVERQVSEPILKFCTALSDEDLLDILQSHPDSWVVQAIAGRKNVSEAVSGAVIDAEDVPGGKTLLENEGASITETVLLYIVEKAKTFREWQMPIACRPGLPLSVAKELAEYVDASVRDLLFERNDFDEETKEEVADIFRRRMEFASTDEAQKEGGVIQHIQKMIDEDRLNEAAISDAVAMRDKEFVFRAMAHMAGTDPDTVSGAFETQSPKAIIALSWKAGLSMRMALQLQKEVGHISHKKLLYPRNGTDYPLSDDEIKWQLDFLGLKAA